jgi:Asp/Glu/hydantoin racemase
MGKRVILVHPYRPTMAPIIDAFARLWPEVEVLNLLDESLYADVGADGVLAPDVFGRIETLLRHAAASRADGVIFTGATFGPAVEAARASLALPVLKADEAMCEAIAACRGRVAILCTARRALPVIRAGVEAAAKGGLVPQIDEICVKGAKDARIFVCRVTEHSAEIIKYFFEVVSISTILTN